MTVEEIKEQTLALYDQLPQDEDLRKQQIDIRDKIIELNYTFFGYVASHTFVNNSYITYEDKFQSALLHFCEIWWKFKWKGNDTKRGYRQDVSFGVFFKPRLSEMIDRELTEVKYSIYRPLKLEVGNQIGKHWSQVRYEDLSDPRVKLPPEKMMSLKAIFGSVYLADLTEYENYIPSAEAEHIGGVDSLTDKYSTIEELLVHEMVDREAKLSRKALSEISDMYNIEISELKEKLPVAEQMLYKMCKEAIDLS